jgi:hypothetical protein
MTGLQFSPDLSVTYDRSAVFFRFADGRKDGSVTISLRNFVGEGIINHNPV